MRYLYFEILVISNSVPWASNLMKWSRFKLKTFVNPSNKYLSDWEEPAFFCTFHEQSSFVSTRGITFRQVTATDARFSFRKFSRIKKQIWARNFTTFLSSLYRISDLTLRLVIFWSMCHPSRGLEKNRSKIPMPRSVRGKLNVYNHERHYVNSFEYVEYCLNTSLL